MRNKILVIAVLAILAFVVIKINNSKQSATTATLKIGAILPMTGGYSSIAEEVNRGALLAVEEENTAGKKIEYIVEDDQFKATDSVNAANKLISRNKVDAVFTMAIEEIKPVAPIFNKAKIPILGTWDSNDYMKTAGDYIFSIGFNTEATGEKMAEYGFNKLGVKKVAVIEQIDAWSELISAAFIKKFQALGGVVVMNEKVIVTEQDFRTLITKAKNAGAQGIYFPVNPPGGSRIITQAKELKFNGQLLSADGLIQDEIDAAGKAAENVYQTNIFADNATNLLIKYKAKYGTEASAAEFVTFGYDGIKTIGEAHRISLNKSISLRDALTQVKIQGTGSPINMDGKQYSEKVEKIFKITNGKPELVK